MLAQQEEQQPVAVREFPLVLQVVEDEVPLDRVFDPDAHDQHGLPSRVVGELAVGEALRRVEGHDSRYLGAEVELGLDLDRGLPWLRRGSFAGDEPLTNQYLPRHTPELQAPYGESSRPECAR